MPFPGSKVMPDGWSAHHRPTATSALDAQCVITRQSGSGTTGDDGTWTPPAGATIYSGPCRVVAASRADERLLVVGDAQQTMRRYRVSVRYDTADPRVGDIVEVTAADDAGLVGMRLRVVDVAFGSEQWERDMIGEEFEPW